MQSYFYCFLILLPILSYLRALHLQSLPITSCIYIFCKDQFHWNSHFNAFCGDLFSWLSDLNVLITNGDNKTTIITFGYIVKLFDLAVTNFRDLQRFLIENNSYFAGIRFLKACVRYFLSIFYCSSKWESFKNYEKIFFYFILKLFSFPKYSHFCIFFPFLSTLYRFQRTNGSGITYDVMNWLA